MRFWTAVLLCTIGCSGRSGGDVAPPGAGGTSGSGGGSGSGGSGGVPMQTFPLPAAIDLGGPASGVAVGDVDLDGFRDIAALVERANDRVSLVVAFGDLDGTLAARFERELAGTVTRPLRGSSSNAVAIGDLDGDGWPDVGTASGVALGNGSRGLSWQSFGGEAAHAFQPALFAELDVTAVVRGGADGWLERCDAGGACQPLPGQVPPCAPGEGCAIEDLVSADFDGDSRPDLLAGRAPWLGAPEQSFLWSSLDDWLVPVEIDELAPVDLEAGDIDGDGVADVVAQRRAVPGAIAEHEVWLGVPGGTTPLVRVQTIANQFADNDASALADSSFDTCLDVLHVGAEGASIAARFGTFDGEACGEFLGPHDPGALVDLGWHGELGVPGALGVQQADLNGDGTPEWILRAPPSLRLLAIPPL